MNEVFQKTRELGEAIRRSPEYKAVKAAEDKAMGSERASQTMRHLIELKSRLENAMSENKSDWAELENIHMAIDEARAEAEGIEELVALNDARSELEAMMEKVTSLLGYLVMGGMGDGDDESLNARLHQNARVN